MSIMAETESYPSLGRARFAQLTLALVGLFGAMDIQVVGLLIEPIKRELGLTDIQVGLAYGTAFNAAYGLLAIPAGMLVDRAVRVRLLLIAMVLNCAGLALTGLSHGLWMLVLSKIITGISGAIIYPAAMSLLSDFFSPERRAFGTLSYPIGQQLGNVAALLVGGLGYTALVHRAAANPQFLGGTPPWRVVSLIFAAIGLLIIPLLLAMREPARMEVNNPEKASFKELWDYRRFLIPLFAGLMCVGGSMSGLITWFAPALMRLYKLQPGNFGAAAGAIMLGGSLASAILGGKLANMARAKGGDRAMLLPAAVAVALMIPCTVMSIMPTAIGFAILGALLMIAMGVGLMLPIMAINFQIPNELRGLCMGSYVVVIAVAGMIGAPLVGYVGWLLGGDMKIGYAMTLVSAPLAAAAALSFWIASRTQAGVSTAS